MNKADRANKHKRRFTRVSHEWVGGPPDDLIVLSGEEAVNWPYSEEAKARKEARRKWSKPPIYEELPAPKYPKPTGIPLSELDITPGSPPSEWVLREKD